MKNEEKRARQEAAGIPDTPLNISTEELPTGETRILQAHINGVLVADLNLPGNVIAALDWYATDEGMLERNSRPNVREPSGVTLGRDADSKALDERRDDVRERGKSLYEARDQFKEAADRYATPGMRPRFLSAAKAKDGGGTGEYEVVKYPDNDPRHGEPVKVRGMVLGQMPEEKAVARTKFYAQRGNQLLNQIGEKYKKEGGATAVSDQ